MFDITEKVIQSHASEVIYRRGLDYYVKNRVIRMDIEAATNKRLHSKEFYILAWVESSTDLDEYKVEVEFNNRTGITFVHCDCEAFSSYYPQHGVCKHVVATLLKYAKEKAKEYNPPEKSKINVLIEQLKGGLIHLESEKRKLSFEIKYEFQIMGERLSSVELKVGENKTYVVKNMRDFLKAVYGNEVLEFGKGFTFTPAVHGFAKEDKEILDLLLEVYEMDEKIFSVNSYYANPNRLISGKKANLTEAQAKRLFTMMRGKPFPAVILGEAYEGVQILEENLPLEFNLLMDKDKILLRYEENRPIPLTTDGGYYFYRNNIYHPDKEQIKTYIPFYNAFINDRKTTIAFDKEESEKIASYILPSLKKISKQVKIDKNLEKDFYEEALQTNFYLDKEREAVSLEVKFMYGAVEINPLKENVKRNEQGILIRDAQQELEILGLLEIMGFSKEKGYFLLENQDRVIDFLTEGISKLHEKGEIFYSETFKTLKIYTPSNYKSSVRLNDNNLLEFSFQIDGVEQEELKNIFMALRQKRKYYRLKKGGFVPLDSKEIQDIGSLIEYLDIKESDLIKDKITLSKYNALYIDQSLKQNPISYLERNKKFREMVNNIREVQEMDYNLSDDLNKVMRNYQKVGFKWFKTLSTYGFGGILADEMGLGKTLEAIAFIDSEKRENGENKKPSLVVAPTSLVYNWKNEIDKFAPHLNAVIISGSKNEREEQRKTIEEADIVITSYPLIRRDIEEYKEISFRYCILDEAQQIKNPGSMNAQSVKEIKAEGYFALTGTPIENSLTELWSIFDFIMPGYLLTHGKFMKKYEVPILKGKDEKALEELNNHIKPFILRRLKKEVIKELPPKIEHKIVVEMTEEQKKLYMAYLTEAKNEIDEEINVKGYNRSKIKILSVLTRLRQICCEPSVFIENYTGESGKMLALDDLLEESLEEGHRVLLFSQFTSVLKSIEKRFQSSGIEYLYLDGQTKTEERGMLVKDFNDGKGQVFLISLKAGGTGLNLTGADVVIHFDPWWNPAVEDQASDRAHRIGQKKTVEIIKLISQGTIEEKIFDLQEKKKEMIQSIIGEGTHEEVFLSQMSQEELEDLFNM